MPIEDTATSNGFPCMRCQQGTVIHKSPLVLECQTCFAAMPTPHHEQEHDAAIEVDAEPLLEPGGTSGPAGPIQLIGNHIRVRRRTYGGACPQCGQFFAWQSNAVACPSCQTKYRAGPFPKVLPILLGATSVFIFVVAGFFIAMPLDIAKICGIGILVIGSVSMLFTGMLMYRAHTHDQLPLIDSRLLTPDELARVSLSSLPQVL